MARATTHLKFIVSINHRRSKPNQGLNTKSVAYQSPSLTTTIYCCIQILYKLEEILQFIINTHTIGEGICTPTIMGRPLGTSTIHLTPAVHDDGEEAPGHIGRLESFPHAYSKSVAIIFIIIIYYNYLNLFRHRKSFRRKQSRIEHNQNIIATGVCC